MTLLLELPCPLPEGHAVTVSTARERQAHDYYVVSTRRLKKAGNLEVSPEDEGWVQSPSG